MRDTPDQILADAGAEIPSSASLQQFLTVQAWADRHIPKAELLLGHLVTRNTRLWLVGSTGLGKTMLGFAIAEGMASGNGFLHWRSCRPARVLYIDGEMASELIKARSLDALRRSSMQPKPGMLMIYSQDFAEQTAKMFPSLGKMPPLDTEAGHTFVKALISMLGDVDVVIFDNAMSLTSGDMKEEITWNAVQPLVAWLTERQIGQVWFDHTGHNTGRQYGSSRKAWAFDSVGVMTSLPKEERQGDELAFQLSFESPDGKARRRTPECWQDFETCIVRLNKDRWTGDLQATGGKPIKASVSPVALTFYRALLDALAIAETPGETTRTSWYGECVRLGLLDPINDADTHQQRERKAAKLRKYLAELKVAGWVSADGETVKSTRKTG